jgi:hypothetical protein
MMQRVPKKDNTKLYYSNPKSREVLKQKVRQVFNLFDTDGSGDIDSKEFHDLVYSMGKIMTDEEVAKYLAVLDRDGNGSISFDEFFDWWCTRDDSNHKDHSADKLKEVKAKLQSRSLMRSISYLINKAKKDVEAEKEKISKNSSNTNESVSAPKSSSGQDPKSFVVDATVKIGNLPSENAKSALRLSYSDMPTPAKLFRLEFLLTDGATDQDAEKIKQIFVAANDFCMGMIFQDVNMTLATHGNVRHATVELLLNSAGPAEATLRDVNLKKLQFSLEFSQRIEELDLKTLELNFGIHLEASRLILALLPPNVNLGPIQTGLFSMMQRVAFEIAFKNVTEAVNNEFNYKKFFEGLTAMKEQVARNIRGQLTNFGVDSNLPIAELKQVMVQVEHSAFVYDITGVDLGFIFKDAPVEVRAPQVPVLEHTDAKTLDPTPEPLLVAPVLEVKPVTPAYLSRFIDAEDLLPTMSEAEREASIEMDRHVFSAKKVDEMTGREFPVMITYYGNKTANNIQLTKLHKEEFEMWQKLVGYPYTCDFMDIQSEGDYTCTAITDYIGQGYLPLVIYLAQLREEKTTWEEFEPIAKMLSQKLHNMCMIFGKNYVMHSLLLDLFLIHPQSHDMRLTMVGTFCEPPVAQMPEGLPEMYLPPEMFTVEGSTNYGSAVDVWMYGICCYAICTNNIPYIVSETGEGLEKLVSGEWDKESPHFTNLPEKVRNFILRLLVLDPAARPTFNELVNDPWFHN